MCRPGVGFSQMIQKGKNRSKFNWSYNFDQIPDRVGIYAFWCRDNGRCVYVGQAKDQPVKERLRGHWRCSHNKTFQNWIQSYGKHLDVCFVFSAPEMIDRLERRLIRLWKPEANERHNPNRRRSRQWQRQ